MRDAAKGRPPDLRIRLLGELEVDRAGRRVALPASKKTRALLAYLVATGRPHLRDALCDLLWDGPDDPRAALRWSLTKLRPVVDDARAVHVVADRERVGFELGAADLDVARVRRLVGASVATAETDGLAEAAELFRGPFLEGLDLPGSHRYHAWCAAEREAMRSLHVAARTALIDRLRPSPVRALVHARALVGLDPLAESSHVEVVRLLGALGRTQEAIHEYERCRRILDLELGVKPSAEMERARMALGRGRAAVPAGVAAAPVAADPAADSGARPAPTSAQPPGEAVARAPSPARVAQARAPLVGRTSERERLLSLVRAARETGGREVVLITGEPGIGKTRMLEELRALVEDTGGRALAGRAFEAEAVRPYGAWIEVLRQVALAVPAAAVRRELALLLPEVPASAGSAPAPAREGLYEAVRDLLAQAMPSAGPLLVMLDDLQWADEASCALLHYLARVLAGKPVLLACAARAGELGDNQAALRLVRALDRDRRLLTLALGRLDAAAITDLLAAIDPALDAAQIFAESEGNPLFALEAARALDRRAPGEPSTMAQLIADRLARLDETAQLLLPWMAALGRSFSPDALVRIVGLPPVRLVAALDDLERRGVLRATESGGYDFTHDLVRRTAYRNMSEPRRRLVHLHTARALADAGDADGALAGEIAHHAWLGGDRELAARAAVRAGDRCLRLFAHGEAFEAAERGARTADGLPPAVRVRIQLEAARIAILSGREPRRGRDIDARLVELVAESRDAGLEAETAYGLYLRSVIQFEGGDFDGAVASSLDAVALGDAGNNAAALSERLAKAARCLFMIEREMPRAQSLLGEAEVLAHKAGQRSMELQWGSGILHAYAGEYEEARTRLEAALAIARKRDLHWESFECLMRLALCDLDAGNPRGALDRSGALDELAAKMKGGSEAPASVAVRALARAALGLPDGATQVEQALDMLRDIDAKGLLAFTLTRAAEMDEAAGLSQQATRRASEALEAATAVGRRSQAALARAVLARLAVARGDRDHARAEIEALAVDRATPMALSFRARDAVERLAAALDDATFKEH